MPKLDRSEIERLVELSGKAAQTTMVRVPSESDPSVWEDRQMLDGHALDAFEKALAIWFRANSAALLELEQDARRYRAIRSRRIFPDDLDREADATIDAKLREGS